MVTSHGSGKTCTRRSFLKIASLGAGVLLAPALVLGDEPLEGIVHMSIIDQSEESIQEDDLNRIAQESMPYIKDLMGRFSEGNGYPRRVTQIVKRSFSDEQFSSREAAEPFIHLGKQLVADALSYWNCEQLAIPIVSYAVPERKAEIEVDYPPFSEDKTIVINLLGRSGIRYETGVVLHYAVGDLTLDLDLTIPVMGRSDRVCHFSKNGGAIYSSTRRKPVLWAIEEEDTSSVYETPVHEILHNQISVWTDKHILDGLRQLNPQPGNLQQAGMELATTLSEIEETLVDGISTAWLMKYAQQQGLPLVPTYHSSEASKRLALNVRERTPQAVIKSYVELGPQEFAKRL
ncbi:hypothetical protein HYT52_00980 [Candidatus Woesearchaeota archaeon]|nr:hypothetical protein [Candidatus Woesearchaeota archaeon]